MKADSAGIAVEALLQSEKLWTRVRTDEQGHYTAEVEPGTYTIFAVFGDKAYLNLFTATGNFWHLNVEKGTNYKFDIENTEEAWF